MNSRILRGTAMAGLVALALPVQLDAQQLRYKLVDVGTFGGPNAVVNGPGTRDFSNAGTYAGEADTSTPDWARYLREEAYAADVRILDTGQLSLAECARVIVKCLENERRS